MISARKLARSHFAIRGTAMARLGQPIRSRFAKTLAKPLVPSVVRQSAGLGFACGTGVEALR